MKNWIISIGVSQTKNYAFLSSAVNDAIDVFSVIRKNWQCESDNSILLTDKYASSQDINIALNEIIVRRAEKEDRIFVYLSGHIKPDVRSITGSFVSSDFDERKRNFGLNLRSLRYIVEDSKANYIIVILDACYSGVIAQGLRTLTPHWVYFSSGEMDSESSTKIFITATASGQKAFEVKGKRNSMFTELILSIIEESLINGMALSTSMFFELLSKKANEMNIPTPVKSGVELGYTIFLFPSNGQQNRLLEIKDSFFLPEWFSQIKKEYVVPSSKFKCEFIRDNNYPDGSVLRIGQTILKSWRVRNTGKQAWNNIFLKMISESRGTARVHAPKLIPIPLTKPGEEIDIEVKLRMPPYPGAAYAEFKFVDSSGTYISPNKRGLYVAFDVVDRE